MLRKKRLSCQPDFLEVTQTSSLDPLFLDRSTESVSPPAASRKGHRAAAADPTASTLPESQPASISCVAVPHGQTQVESPGECFSCFEKDPASLQRLHVRLCAGCKYSAAGVWGSALNPTLGRRSIDAARAIHGGPACKQQVHPTSCTAFACRHSGRILVLGVSGCPGLYLWLGYGRCECGCWRQAPLGRNVATNPFASRDTQGHLLRRPWSLLLSRGGL